MKPVKFFCEFCGHEVKAADIVCPHCGSFFSRVRCQACGHTGDSRDFLQGCPVCGFQAGAANAVPSAKNGTDKGGHRQKLPWTVEELAGPRKSGTNPKKDRIPGMVWGILITLFAAFMAGAWFLLKG